MVQIITFATIALLVNWLPLMRIQPMPFNLFHFWDGARYFTCLSTRVAQSVTLTIITLLVGWLPLFSVLHPLTEGLLRLLVRGRWSNALLVIS